MLPEAADPSNLNASPQHGVDEASADRSPSFLSRHRRAVGWVLAVLVAGGFVYYVLPRIVGLGPTLRLLRGGDLWWLAIGVVLEAISFIGEIVLFRGVFARPGNRIDWKASYRITMAGAAATKLLGTAGAGGIALTVWALRSFGVASSEVATGMVCFEILTYGVYAAKRHAPAQHRGVQAGLGATQDSP